MPQSNSGQKSPALVKVLPKGLSEKLKGIEATVQCNCVHVGTEAGEVVIVFGEGTIVRMSPAEARKLTVILNLTAKSIDGKGFQTAST